MVTRAKGTGSCRGSKFYKWRENMATDDLEEVTSSGVGVATLAPAAPSRAQPKYPRPAVLRGIRWLVSYAWLAIALAYLIPVSINVAQRASQGGVDALSANATSTLYVDQATSLWGSNPAVVVLGAITILLLLVVNVVAGLDRRRERTALQDRRVQSLSQGRISEAERALEEERERTQIAERKRVETESRLAALEQARQAAEARAQAAMSGMSGMSGMVSAPAYTPVYTPTMAAPDIVRAPGWTTSKPIFMGRLGARIDGWADTVDGLADRAPALLQAFAADLPSHLMPHVRPISAPLGISGIDALAVGVENPLSPTRAWPLIGRAFSVIPRSIPTLFGFRIGGKQRSYQLAAITPGATVAININRTGQDLYLCWDLFVKRVWNEVTIALVIGLGALWSLLVFLLALIGVARLGSTVQECSAFFGCVDVPVDKGELIRADLIGIIPDFLGALVVVTALFLVAGLVFRGEVQGFFRKRIDLFEADDIAALMLVVDKSIRKAADKVGIDKKLLRPKEGFKAGESNRLI